MNDSIEEDLFRVIESLLEAACKSNSYCDLIFVQDRLLKLETNYYNFRNILGKKVEELEDAMSKKWSTQDRALMVVSFGIFYPLIRKYHRSDREQLICERTRLVNRIVAIEKNYLRRIKVLTQRLDKHLKDKK